MLLAAVEICEHAVMFLPLSFRATLPAAAVNVDSDV
jgi:hypothetical protein